MRKQQYAFLFFILYLLALGQAYAQEVTSMKANGLKKLQVSGYIKVELVKGNEEKVEFTASEEVKRHIKVRVSGDRVKIKGSPKALKRISYRRTKIKVFYKEIEAVKVRNGADLKAADLIKSKDFELVVIEGANADLKLQTRDLTARISMGAEVALEGTTDTFQVRVKMGASLDAYAFKTNVCYVKTGMGANASVFAREAIHMSAGMGSSIKYRGNPKRVLKSWSWMGSDIRSRR